MHRCMFHKYFARYVHSKNVRLPELDFSKPMSDHLRKTKTSLKERNHVKHDDQRALLKVPLRGQCLFGIYPIELALKRRTRQFYQLFLSNTSNENRQIVQNIQRLAEELSIPIKYTSTSVLDRLSFDRPHQGVCLDCSSLPIQQVQLEHRQTNLNKISLDLCLVKIHDPMNLGAIIRTAYFFGIDRVILTLGTCYPSPVASKASSGALELVSLYTCSDLKSYLNSLIEQKQVALIGATHHGTVPLQTLRIDEIKQNFSSSILQRIVLLIGNEHEGIPEEITKMCHHNLCIHPNVKTEISSLNASVACALFLYHISAQLNM